MSCGARRRLRSAPYVVAAVLATLAACDGSASDGSSVSGTLPLGGGTFDEPRVTTAASDLAPSQVGASTVPPPTLVSACAAEAVEVVAGDAVDGVDQVVDLVNRGSASCEVDISGTADASPDIEPSVVLGPGEVGHLWVSDRGGCDRTTADPQVEFDLIANGAVYPVTITFVAYCGVELWALFTD